MGLSNVPSTALEHVHTAWCNCPFRPRLPGMPTYGTLHSQKRAESTALVQAHQDSSSSSSGSLHQHAGLASHRFTHRWSWASQRQFKPVPPPSSAPLCQLHPGCCAQAFHQPALISTSMCCSSWHRLVMCEALAATHPSSLSGHRQIATPVHSPASH
jgi:hypothetical protein